MSKNFELMRQSGRDPGLTQPAFGSTEVLVSRGGPHDSSVPDDQVSDWLRAAGTLRTHWKLSALFAFVLFSTVVCVTFLMKPTYESTAKIEVDPPGEAFSLERGDSRSNDGEYLETQAQILRSDRLAVAVIRGLHLDQNPDLVGDPTAGAKNEAKVARAADALQLSSAEQIAFENFEGRLKVRRDTASRLILVSFASHDPQLAAQVANTVGQTFIEDSFQTRHNAIMKSTEWLSRQLDDIRTKMEESSHALTQFQGSIGVADVDENKSTYTEHMGALSQQFTQAESERIQLQALLKNVHDGNPDSLPDVRSNPVVQQLSQKLAEQRAELSQVLVVYGKNHLTARKLQSQVDELQSQLDAQKRVIVNSLKASYAAAEARESLMAAEMKGTTKQIGQMARYAALKKEVQTNVELYNSLYAKIKEAGIVAGSKSGNIRIVDQARVLATPTRPNWLLNLCVGLFAALLGGVVIAFVAEQFDNRLRTPNDITNWVGKSNIAIIPVITQLKSPFRLLPGKSDDHDQSSAFVLERPDSPEAEALHSLQASIMLAQPGLPPQVLLVASSFPGEGKTTVALNLALSLAQQGATCLVDADLRKGDITARFDLRSRPGLADFLSGTTTVKDILLPASDGSNLAVLPAGISRMNPGQLICSPNASLLFHELRQRFRFIVIDSVPILPFADGRVLSPLADAVVFVGRAGVTTRSAMRRSMELLAQVHAAPILEFVLNAADMSSPGYGDYQYGYAGYKATSSKS